ncbi:hypothetical protein [Rhizobium aegyptiacum]|uniref:hypothetical protein n=1 Tax=Rhizobium aegyptiacum TaxID=1764550 RepID=UPI0007E534DB|nr:hypothetical protein [Rhizobium aegyptiacum]
MDGVFDVFPTERLYQTDLSEPEIVLSGPGRITASRRPGHGFRPNTERLAHVTRQYAAVSTGTI